MSAVVAHPSLNRAGGAEKVCLTVVSALNEHGFKVELATIEKTDWRFLEEGYGALSRPSTESYIFDKMPMSGSFSQAALTLSCFLPELVYLRLRRKHDVIVNTYGDLADSIGDISYVNALPIRLTECYPQAGFSSSFAWRLGAQSHDILLRAASGLFRQNVLVVNSRFTQSVVTKCLNRTSSVVYPPVDVGKFKQSENDKNRENLVVTVSRLRSGKNLELVPRIAAHVPTARFVVIGLADRASGRAMEDLTKEIERLGVGDRVQLFVNQPFQKLRDVLVSSKVFLHTQPTEAFGISIVEAMAAGCVPIVPRWGGPWFDILDIRESQYGFSYESAEEAARKIRLILENEGLRKRVAARAVKRAMGFDASVFKRKISSIVERVCLEKNSR